MRWGSATCPFKACIKWEVISVQQSSLLSSSVIGVDLTADDNIQEVEPVLALTKDELKAMAQEYMMVDNHRCWVWKHVGLLKTLTFSASQEELYSHVCLRCLEKNPSLFNNNCLIAVFDNQSSNAISHMSEEEAQGAVGSGARYHCGLYSQLSSSRWEFRAVEPKAGIITWLVN